MDLQSEVDALEQLRFASWLKTACKPSADPYVTHGMITMTASLSEQPHYAGVAATALSESEVDLEFQGAIWLNDLLRDSTARTVLWGTGNLSPERCWCKPLDPTKNC